MANPIRKQLQILYERLKVPGKLVSLFLRVTGIYKRGFKNAHDLRLHRHELIFDKLPPVFDGYTMMVMSDLHIDSDLYLVPEIKKLMTEHPTDVVLFLGDYRFRLTGAYDVVLSRMSELFDAARVKDGIYAIRGNHDPRELMQHFPGLGARVLDNQSIKLEKKGESIYIIGVDEPHYDKADDLPAATENLPDHALKILLAHTSEIYKEAEALGIDLYLCGHTHGGQICLKKFGPVITNVHAPRHFASGFWRYKNMRGFTSTGVGISSVPVRFNCPPEIVLFTLRTDNHATD